MMRMSWGIVFRVSVVAVTIGIFFTGWHNTSAQEFSSSNLSSPTPYRSPLSVTAAPDGQTIYVTDRTGGNLVVLDRSQGATLNEIALRDRPQGLVLSSSGDTLYVAEHRAGSVAVIDAKTHRVTSRIMVGKWPTAVALAEKSQRLYVGNQDRHSVSVVDLQQNPPQVLKEILVSREPSCLSITPDEQFIVVTNLLAYGRGTDPTLSSELSIVNGETLELTAAVKLPPGSSMVPGVCLSPDGRWAYVVHGLGRFNLPITQLERGWVNTFALSIIDIPNRSRLATMLLDDLMQGAADPHSIVCSSDGGRLWISHTGVHEISVIDIGLVHELLRGNVPESLAAINDAARANIWVQIQHDPSKIADLENDLTALHLAGAIRRFSSGGTGPRGLALSPDGQQLLVANYFSNSVAVLDADSGRLLNRIPLGPHREPDSVRRGEIIFHDATHAFQRWHSCASCHANDGRIDGLRWDFLGDGIGNAKDTMSLLHLDKTEPMNRRATMASAYDCTRNGLESTHMLVPTEQEVEDLFAYLTSLRPVPSPHLTPEGKLTVPAERGKTLFEGSAKCSQCHPGPYFTDNKMHNVGVLSETEPDGQYDTPSLIEAYRTAPYLHDGRALTLKDVLTVDNIKHRHGQTDGLTDRQIDDLVAYLLSL